MSTPDAAPRAAAEAVPEVVHLYLYYRLRPDADTSAAAAQVRAMQAGLARRSGIEGRLMRRTDDPLTWMEIYEGVSDRAAFMQALDAAVLEHRLTGLLADGGTRHAECFTESIRER
ncbi:DUF4936 family protein [Thauera sp. Sel9]|uniref:DUF4936 family protein n=1 Tax=Thauera sp. Sel9 TaxID=2974299 RepID=UPI0021E12AFC|nr:DUF4936 family protein [Thauera sp. Sel9]MCV2217897.1 DUF4936 family protein [Thauera sp. Sel9]